MTPGMLVGVGLLAVIAVEQVLLVRGVAAYYAVALPAPVEALPIDQPPTEAGRTPSVRYTVHGDEVRYHAAADHGLAGLHGVVRLVPDRGRYRLFGTWAPPWSLLVFGVAVGLWGAVQGFPLVSTGVGTAIVLGSLAAYQAAAVQAMAELRWAFVRDDAPED